MLFTEFSFIFLFLPITLACFYSAGSVRASLAVLTVASLVFYGAYDYRMVPVLCTAIIVNYLIACRIERTSRDFWFYLGIFLALTPLIYFKYSGFLSQNVGLGIKTGIFNEKLGSLLPLGISFYTFQQITYLSDVRAGKIQPGGFLEYAFFKLFFPQLIAGPIVHYNQLVPQIGKPIDRERLFLAGLAYFVVGFVKKFFIADGFSAFSDPVFDATGSVSTQAAIMAVIGYTFQIYFDFSGYSDMALGLARLFGFRLPWNFDSPYKARSVSDFWRRWHMTLSTFLRDYVYIPLGGNRRGEVVQYRNLLLTMLIGGLWHGAAWTFVVWGGLHGLGLAINHFWNRYIRLPLFGLGWPLTFLFASLLWVLFRATSFERALEIYQGLIAFQPLSPDVFWLWAIGGLGITWLLPNSQQISEKLAKLMPALPSRLSVRAAAQRTGVYAALSGVVLYGLTAAYYTTPLDRFVFGRISASTFPPGMDNRFGDFRNNLWAKEIFSADSTPSQRIILAGSSFVGSTGEFSVVASNRVVAASQTLGMGGNGILNGARQVDATARSQAVGIVFLGVSPLNFGSAIPYAPFDGQCMDGIASAAQKAGYTLKTLRESSCLPNAVELGSYLDVFKGDRHALYQFREFVHKLADAIGNSRKDFPQFSIEPEQLTSELAALKHEIETAHVQPVSDPANGEDARFKWNSRKVPESLRPGGLGYTILSYLRDVTARNGVRLVIYETPTPSHTEAPNIYPAGFFEDYQAALRSTLKELGIPYIDLSRLYPWNGSFAWDFVHLQPQYRQVVHKLLLAWLFHPEILAKSGLVPEVDLPPHS